MKKMLLMATALCSLAAYAQRNNVESAAIYLRNNELEDAKKSIDAASVHDETRNDPKMWYYYASVYDSIYINPAFASLDKDAIEKFANGCLKCMELDTKKRYDEYCQFMTINAAFATYNKALEYYQAKDAVNAQKFFDLTLKAMPYDKNGDLKKNNISEKNIQLSMGYLGVQTENYELAKVNLQKLIDVDYQEPTLYRLMGNIYMMQKDTAKGLSYIEAGRTKFPTDRDLINMELNVYLAQGRQDVLLTKLNDALALDPENIMLLFVRGNVYDNFAANAIKTSRNAKDSAAVLSKKAKTATPALKSKLDADARKQSKLADTSYKMNKVYVTNAEADYKKVIELKEDYIDAYYNLGALTNNKTTEIVEKMNAVTGTTQAEYDRKWNVLKKEQDAILQVALGYFTKALELAEGLPETESNQRKEKIGIMVSILTSMQQVYANLGDEQKTMETKRKRVQLEGEL
ncbi:MAG: hypothetical protein MUE96_00405 [Bacteroidia bacterium]|jgi:hypothetical protein|nr:hypothetical protein [Bacteroidia bacterium]